MKDSRLNHRVAVLASIGMFALLQSANAAPTPAGRSAAPLADLPLTFEKNRGQTDDRVGYLARGPGYNIFLTSSEAVLTLPRPKAARGAQSIVRMQLVGAVAHPKMAGLDALPGTANYFHGRNAASWQTRVPTYKRVQYSGVYPGVDLVYYGQRQQLEYDFIVAPGADPRAIKLAFAGVEQTTVDAQGDLVLKTRGAPPLRFHKPVVYQMDGEHRRIVEGSYAHGRAHPLDQLVVAPGRVGGGGGGAAPGRVAGHVDVVRDRHRHPGQRQREPVRAGVDAPGLGQHPLRVVRLERAEVRVPGGDPGQVRPGHVGGAAAPVAHPGGDGRRGQGGQVQLVHQFTVALSVADRTRDAPVPGCGGGGRESNPPDRAARPRRF